MNSSVFTTAAAALALLFTLAACEARDTDVTDGADTGSASDTMDASTSEERWTQLFTGESLDDWKGYQTDSIPGKWVIDDNAIHYNPDVDGSSGDIVTREQYGNFELAFDWKIGECGNSGVIYLASEDEEYRQPWNTGPEYQILDNSCHPDAEVGAHRQSASNYDVHPPSEDVTRPAGEWNEARIVVDGARVEHWLNGTKVVEYELDSEDWRQRVSESKWTDYPAYGTMREGHIALQDHGDPVWFRNVRIRKL